MICRKCNETGEVVIKNDYIYCKSCYLANLNHKFRACIGKNKVIRPNEKILIALSGGLGSTALLDLIHTGITLNTHKKLRIQPIFVHLTGEDEQCNTDVIKDQCQSYGFDVEIYNISNYTSSNKGLLSDLNTKCSTISNDVIGKIIQNILASVAKELQCRLIFTAEPATDLAAKLLSDIVIGRGSQVENDIGFMDNRHENIKILRPLRDITKEELQHYVKIKGIVPVINNTKHTNLQSVIDRFITGLEKDSPATISTICKTADKIGSDDNESENNCVFCKGKLDKDTKKLTAIQAIIFSRMVSYRNKQYELELEQMGNSEAEISDQSMLPFIHQHLCYSCSRTYADIENPNLRKHMLGVHE